MRKAVWRLKSLARCLHDSLTQGQALRGKEKQSLSPYVQTNSQIRPKQGKKGFKGWEYWQLMWGVLGYLLRLPPFHFLPSLLRAKSYSLSGLSLKSSSSRKSSLTLSSPRAEALPVALSTSPSTHHTRQKQPWVAQPLIGLGAPGNAGCALLSRVFHTS